MKEQKSNLLEQKYMTLDVSYQNCKESDKELNGVEALKAEIEILLQGEKKWINAYKIEQLLVPLYHANQLDLELSRRVVDTRKHLNESVYHYYKNRVQATDVQDKQYILAQMIKDLQWQDKITSIKQDYIKDVSITASTFFIITIYLYFLPEMSEDFVGAFLKDAGTGNERAYFIYTAMVVGAMGAVFSMLIALRGRELSIYDPGWGRNFFDILLRWVIGLGSGLIFFYFLQSGLLEGSFFPDFTALEDNSELSTPQAKQAFSLMIIWCFLSGFSEMLVPNILIKTEKQAKQEM